MPTGASFGSERTFSEKDKRAWMKASQALVDAGAVALKAAEAKNVDALVDAGNQIADVCETCHERYLDKGR